MRRDSMMAALYIVAGALGLFASRFPLSDSAPTELAAVFGTFSIVAGGILLFLRKPVSDLVVIIYALCGIILLSVLISKGRTELGIAIAAMTYLWFCVFFGAYLRPLQARVLIFLLCASFGVALIISDVPATTSLWVVFTATMVVTTEALLASNHALRVMARQDPLTGLLNRRGLEEAVGPILAIGDRIGQPTSVALIDLDDFKVINDSRGHAAGDRLLREIAAAWSSEKREADLLARYGGDEFVIVMPATEAERGRELIDRWHSAHPVSWSFGIAEIGHGEELLTALERADRDLYKAKPGAAGKPRFSMREST